MPTIATACRDRLSGVFVQKPRRDNAWCALLGIVFCVFLVGCSSVQTSGVRQIVEVREGRRSVWGIELCLADAHFNRTVASEELSVVDGKYGRETTDSMAWSVGADRHTLRIVFKPGSGDFGSGNGVTIRVRRSAVSDYAGPSNSFEWQIPTDPL